MSMHPCMHSGILACWKNYLVLNQSLSGFTPVSGFTELVAKYLMVTPLPGFTDQHITIHASSLTIPSDIIKKQRAGTDTCLW